MLPQSTQITGIGSLLDLESVKNGIRNIFSYKKGERIILPAFGNNLNKFLYEPINNYTAENIGLEISSMISTWDPRVNIIKVLVIPKPDDNQYDVAVIYSVPSLNNQPIKFNTVLSK
jgi:phage baseplate assembly protein W